MGAGQSKNRNARYPYAVPQYPPVYPPPPQFVPPYGYGQPMYPTGVIPPGAFGAQVPYGPPALLNYLPQDKYFKKKSSRANKSRRTQSERFVGGFSAGAGMPQPEEPSRRNRSASYSQPLEAPIQYGPARRPTQRAATPYVTQDELDMDENDDEDPVIPNTAPQRSASRRSASRYPTPPPIVADLAHVLEPLEPPGSAAYGPPGPLHPRMPLRNPLPPPPRDLYEMTPYKSLLNLPQTTALLTATYPPQQTVLATTGMGPNADPMKRKNSIKAGLLRAFSRKDKHKGPEQPQVRFIPVFVPPSNDKQGQQPVSASTLGPFPTSATSFNSIHANTSAMTPLSADHPQPIPPVPTSPPAIRFDQTGRYASFMNHSPHRVIWRGLAYPTALHLHEALKFLDHRPDLAEKIRTCGKPEDVYPLSADFQHFQRPDWGQVFLDFMKQVLYEKFRQHPDLRSFLLQTANARLIYVDAEDTYWGSGAQGNGENQLGKALVEIRDRLFQEMNPTSMTM